MEQDDHGRRQVFVSGTWKSEKAAPFAPEAKLLGKLLARRGFDLACGPGTGIARHVVDGYRSEAYRGHVRYYLPTQSEMDRVGEIVEAGADEVIRTEFDYPMRNVWQVKQSQGVVVLTGGDGTLEEVLPALIDYNLPVAVVEGTGSAAQALRLLLQIYPAWGEAISFGQSVIDVFGPFAYAVERRQ